MKKSFQKQAFKTWVPYTPDRYSVFTSVMRALYFSYLFYKSECAEKFIGKQKKKKLL